MPKSYCCCFYFIFINHCKRAVLFSFLLLFFFCCCCGFFANSGFHAKNMCRSDTESHTDVNKSEGKRKFVIQLNNLFRKRSDKPEAPSNDEEDNAPPSESTVVIEDEPQKKVRTFHHHNPANLRKPLCFAAISRRKVTNHRLISHKSSPNYSLICNFLRLFSHFAIGFGLCRTSVETI